MAGFDETLEWISKIQSARNLDDVCSSLLELSGQFGMDALMAGTVPDPKSPSDIQEQHVILCRWPGDWLSRYVKRNYIDCDPIVRRMRQSSSPVIWREAYADDGYGNVVSDMIGDAGEYRLRDGIAMPLTTLEGRVIVASLGGEAVDCSRQDAAKLSLVTTYAIGRAMLLMAERSRQKLVPDLTDRETECLRWAAIGKSEWEISQILGISEHTSERHLLNAKRKLGAANRVQAVAEAIRLGLVA